MNQTLASKAAKNTQSMQPDRPSLEMRAQTKAEGSLQVRATPQPRAAASDQVQEQTQGRGSAPIGQLGQTSQTQTQQSSGKSGSMPEKEIPEIKPDPEIK